MVADGIHTQWQASLGLAAFVTILNSLKIPGKQGPRHQIDILLVIWNLPSWHGVTLKHSELEIRSYLILSYLIFSANHIQKVLWWNLHQHLCLGAGSILHNLSPRAPLAPRADPQLSSFRPSPPEDGGRKWPCHSSSQGPDLLAVLTILHSS